MPTYKVSPFDSPSLQSFIFTGAGMTHNAKVNAIGTSGTVNAIRKSGGSGANYILIWDGVTATTEEADIVIPVTGTSADMAIYIDKGILCSTAITLAVSGVPQGGSAQNGTVNVNLFCT
jgi:hypothetical protein